MRHVVWFSCGAASAVAAWLSTQLWDDTVVVYCDVMEAEHPDNQRFFNEVQEWIGQEIITIRSDKYDAVEEVWADRRYMAGIAGAPCTTAMKKIPRYKFQDPEDIHIFGYTADEQKRIKTFEDNNPELDAFWVLAEARITKNDCYRLLEGSHIRLPILYGLGYKNNNCLGCVKATSAKYWNMVRRDFPAVFEARSVLSRDIGAKLTRMKGQRIFLDELPIDYLPANSDVELPDLSCGPVCSTGIEV